MSRRSELDILPRYIFAIVAVGFLLVVLNAIFVFQLSQASSALEKQLTGFHLPSTTYLNNLLVEVREVQFLNENPQTDADGNTRNTTADLLLQRYYLINENIQALMELPQQREATAFDDPEKRLLSQYNNWLASGGALNKFEAPPPAQRLALERFRLSLEQLYRLHLQKLRSLSTTVHEENQKQAWNIFIVSIASLVIGGVIIGRALQLMFTSLRRHRDNEQSLRNYRERLEEMVSARTMELEQLLQETESFNYSVSHDLRAPLRAIDGFSQALAEDLNEKLDESSQDYLQRIRTAAQRMGEIIDDLLSLSRMGRIEIDTEPVDLCQLADEFVTVLKQRHPHPPIEFSCDITEWIKADPRLLRVVLENLLDNARKFSSKRPYIQITIGTRLIDNENVYFVRDNGDGFDMNFASKLFKPFQRLHNNNDFEGTGIGLATVARVIHRHNGRIWAESAPGQGATILFTIGEKPAQYSPRTTT